MIIDRRWFLLSLTCLAFPGVAAHAEEPHHISPYDEGKVEYKFRKREVKLDTKEPAGSIIVDTRKKFLYLVLPGGKAMRYGIGVGSQYTRWSGEEKSTA